jgi:mycothiol system anti-sigma-R factor
MGTKREPCTKIVKKMYLMLEGEQAGSMCEKLRSHLEGCASCAKQYRVLEDLVSLCRKFPEEEVPEEQKRRIKEKLLKSLSSGRC